MKRKKRNDLWVAAGLLAAFAAWTALVSLVDVQTIGPNGSAVGLATVNQYFHRLTGVHMSMYHVTDWLGLIPVAVGLGFAVLGLTQWIRRKQLSKVDVSLFALGGFYVAVLAAYLLFEEFVINYRPVLIGGYLEASYPSSTTMLAMCMMPTAAMQLNGRIQNRTVRHLMMAAIAVFTAFMVIGRLISGVHWLSDIIGGALLSAGLVMLYRAVAKRI